MAENIQAAVDQCIKAREEAAAPLKFNAAALKFANERTLTQFTANLAAAGGWEAAGPALLRAATLFGATAKALALFHNPRANEIGLDEADTARTLMEHECRFGLAKRTGKHATAIGVPDGLVCGGGI